MSDVRTPMSTADRCGNCNHPHADHLNDVGTCERIDPDTGNECPCGAFEEE